MFSVRCVWLTATCSTYVDTCGRPPPARVRQEVLGMTQGVAKAPRVVVCGHFHGNVERVESSAFGAPLEVVTTSSVGCPILWNGSATGLYSPAPVATALLPGKIRKDVRRYGRVNRAL